jgi:hypothetical protein
MIIANRWQGKGRETERRGKEWQTPSFKNKIENNNHYGKQ